MRLLKVLRARAIWLFDIGDLNPRGKNLFPECIDVLKDAYRFKKAPDPAATPSNQGGMVFSNGSYAIDATDENLIDVDLTLYGDGMIADTGSSTRDSNLFLESVIEEIRTHFKLGRTEITMRKQFISELHVTSEHLLGSLNPNLQKLCNRLFEMMPEPKRAPYEVAGISFNTDPAHPLRTSPFQFERAVGVPFENQRYYSQAPLHTDEHLTLLNEFEDLLVS